jgi:hypothetical protein
MRHKLALILALATPALVAQGRGNALSTQPEPTGTVTGHVFCTDTNEPARFAKVSLERITDPPPALKSPATTAPATRPAAVPTNIVETSLDGSFSLTRVAPGSYYVVVEKDGYIKPRNMFTQKEIDDPSPQMRELVLHALPRVRVEANQTEQAEVRLEHGAAISGTVLYDDGSPAGGLQIKLLHKDASGKWVQPPGSGGPRFDPGIATDDRGYFRVPSLLSDEYMVEADLNLSETKISTTGDGDHKMMFAMSNSLFELPFYGSGVARQSHAKPIQLRGGEELTGQDMIIPLAKLHKLTGRVAAGPDAHFVNAAKLSLVTREDGKELASTEISREDGLFHFEFVPDGDYLLKVTDARDVVWEPQKPDPRDPFNPIPPKDKERVLKAYGDTEQPIILEGDMLGDIATVPANTVPKVAPASGSGASVNAQTSPAPQSAPAPDPGAPPSPAPQIKVSPDSAPRTTTSGGDL